MFLYVSYLLFHIILSPFKVKRLFDISGKNKDVDGEIGITGKLENPKSGNMPNLSIILEDKLRNSCHLS